MSRTIAAFLMLFALVALPAGTASAQSDKELRDQRSAAQKERNEQKRERDRALSDASRELREHTLLGEMDQAVLRKAESLGLTREPAPILASPIGGELTRPEEQWNERERKEVKTIAERNRKVLAKYENGAKLRESERANAEEDFELDWAEKRELNALASRRMLFGAFMLQADPSKPADGQSLTDRLAEVERDEKLIKIRYDQLRKTKAIERREARRNLGG